MFMSCIFWRSSEKPWRFSSSYAFFREYLASMKAFAAIALSFVCELASFRRVLVVGLGEAILNL
jgi:hypothetical protein